MNPLMQQLSGETLQESPETLVKNLMGILRGNDPQKVIQMMAKRNPQFAQFMRECEGNDGGRIIFHSFSTAGSN